MCVGVYIHISAFNLICVTKPKANQPPRELLCTVNPRVHKLSISICAGHIHRKKYNEKEGGKKRQRVNNAINRYVNENMALAVRAEEISAQRISEDD